MKSLRSKHAKTIFLIFICTATITCKSNPNTSTVDSLDEYQRRAIELANANRDITNRLEQYDRVAEDTLKRLEAIRERANGIKDTAERIIYLFDAYEREVSEIILTFTTLSNDTSSVDSFETSEDSAGDRFSGAE